MRNFFAQRLSVKKTLSFLSNILCISFCKIFLPKKIFETKEKYPTQQRTKSIIFIRELGFSKCAGKGQRRDLPSIPKQLKFLAKEKKKAEDNLNSYNTVRFLNIHQREPLDLGPRKSNHGDRSTWPAKDTFFR